MSTQSEPRDSASDDAAARGVRGSPPLGRVGTALHLGMNLLVTLTVVVACLIPLHASHTTAVTMPFLEKGRSFTIPKPSSFDIRPGEELPIYRYHEDFKPELGRARVTGAEETRLTCELLPETLIFPIGRSGHVTQRLGDWFFVQVGREHLFQPRDVINLFRDYQLIAQLNVVMPAVDGNATATRLGRYKQGGADLMEEPAEAAVGLAVSEYIIPTTVILHSNARWLAPLEVGLILLVLALDVLLFFRRGAGLVAVLGRSGIRFVRRWPLPFAMVTSLALTLPFEAAVRAGITAVGKAGSVPSYSAWAAALVLWALHLGLAATRRRPAAVFGFAASALLYSFLGNFVVRTLLWIPLLKPIAALTPTWTNWAISGLLWGAHLLLFATRREQLPLWFWRWSRSKPRWLLGRIPSARAQTAVIWALHLVVLYFFAYALLGFLSADINVALDYIAPSSVPLKLSVASITEPRSIPIFMRHTLENIWRVAQVGPAPLSFDQLFAALRLGIWAVTIAGCLVGYVHSAVHVLHWSKIRNVDFTLLGWLTNTVCYPMLLGGPLWLSVPYPYGAVPEVAHGPLFYATGLTEIGLNLFYTASVWNMGTKFGVMVDKGLVDRGFYAVIRHPSYFLEALMLFLVSAKTLGGYATWPIWVGASMPLLMYWIRSEREDVFMGASNPDYPAYRERVPYKFIRGFW